MLTPRVITPWLVAEGRQAIQPCEPRGCRHYSIQHDKGSRCASGCSSTRGWLAVGTHDHTGRFEIVVPPLKEGSLEVQMKQTPEIVGCTAGHYSETMVSGSGTVGVI